MLEIRAEAAASVNTGQEISHALLDAWQSMAYTDLQASAVRFYQDATVLRFVTVISGDVLYVSGTVRVAGPHDLALLQRYDRDFGASHGPLPSLGA